LTAAVDFLLTPAVGLSAFLALIYTLAVHLFMGLGFRGLLRHWLVALLGMAAGAGLALHLNSRLPALGDMHVIESSLAAMALLVLAGLRARMTTGAKPA
jgi:hypothetical protein